MSAPRWLSDPPRLLDDTRFGDIHATTRLLKAPTGFKPLDPAVASRVKRAVMQAEVAAGSGATGDGLLGRIQGQLKRFGRHQFTAGQVASTTLGAAALGGLLVVLLGGRFTGAAGGLIVSGSVTDSDSARASLSARNSQALAVEDPSAAGHLALQRVNTDSVTGADGNVEDRAITGILNARKRVSDVLNTAEDNALQNGTHPTSNAPDGAQAIRTPRGDSDQTGMLDRAARRQRSRHNTQSNNGISRTEASESSHGSGQASARSSGDPRGLREETLLLEAARSDLARNPKSALATALEHQQQFPQGQLASQRALIQLEALLRLGQDTNAVNLSHSIQSPLFSARAHDLLIRYGAADLLKD